jgi:hypothetical protein
VSRDENPLRIALLVDNSVEMQNRVAGRRAWRFVAPSDQASKWR